MKDKPGNFSQKHEILSQMGKIKNSMDQCNFSVDMAKEKKQWTEIQGTITDFMEEYN